MAARNPRFLFVLIDKLPLQHSLQLSIHFPQQLVGVGRIESPYDASTFVRPQDPPAWSGNLLQRRWQPANGGNMVASLFRTRTLFVFFNFALFVTFVESAPT